MTQKEFFERYIHGDEGNVEDVEIQKLWVKYGFSDILIETVHLITDREVIEGILSSDLWNDKNMVLKKGKIEKVEVIEKEKLVEHLYEIIIEFFDNEENKIYKLKGIGDKDDINKYQGQEINVIVEKLKDDDELRFSCFLVTNMK